MSTHDRAMTSTEEIDSQEERRIDRSLRIEDQPFWNWVPNRSLLGFTVRDLNGDNIPDLILRHGSSLSLLVARP